MQGGGALQWASRIGAELRAPDTVSPLAIEGALLLLIADISRLQVDGASRRPRWLRLVEDAIEASLAEAPSITELAAVAGVHPSHLLRTFRRHHGMTVAHYVRHHRVERARAAMATAKRPLSMIALESGFSDQSHLTRVFRQTYGETPTQYRRSLRAH